MNKAAAAAAAALLAAWTDLLQICLKKWYYILTGFHRANARTSY